MLIERLPDILIDVAGQILRMLHCWYYIRFVVFVI